MPFLPSTLVVAALIAVESNGNQYAISHDRKGRAHYGVLQIEERLVDDVNVYQGTQSRKKGVKQTKYRFRDMLKREPSIKVFQIYCEMHLPDTATDQDAAMLLRFGPSGMKRGAGTAEGAEYWRRVSATMVWVAMERPVPVEATD